MQTSISLILLGALFSIGACASLSKPTQPPSKCLNEKYVPDVVADISTIIDSAWKVDGVDSSQEKAVLVSDLCNKKIYVKSGYRILLSRATDQPEGVTGTTKLLAQVISQEASMACLKNAEVDFAQMHVEAGTRALEVYKKRFPELYEDADIGPAKWLSCASGPYEYGKSLPTLAHEVAHDLREKNCIFAADGKEAMCFDLSKDLPKRSLGRLKEIPSVKPERRAALEGVQKVYLTDTDQPPLMLFDELNAYTISTQGMIAGMKRDGKASVTAANGNRSANFLTLFMVFTTNYLERLRVLNPTLYADSFVKHQGNRLALLRLFANAEKAQIEFESLRAKLKVKELDFEGNLWRQYLVAKKSLAL